MWGDQECQKWVAGWRHTGSWAGLWHHHQTSLHWQPRHRSYRHHMETSGPKQTDLRPHWRQSKAVPGSRLPELLSTHCLVWIVGVRDMAVLTFDGLATPGQCSAPDWVAVQAAGQRTHRLQLTATAHKWWGNVSSWALGWDDLTRDLASRRPVSGVGELFRLDAKLRINLCFTAVNIGVSADSAVH